MGTAIDELMSVPDVKYGFHSRSPIVSIANIESIDRTKAAGIHW